ncbi:MAG: B12-binding domain-containing radical SAM protein, partial [Eubacterium sp.]
MDKEQLERKILPLVKKPVTYQGNEIGSVHKELTADTIRFAFAFPDVYEVGMSHLGLKILYALLNDQKDIACERVFAP